jgi:hypothetical protein
MTDILEVGMRITVTVHLTSAHHPQFDLLRPTPPSLRTCRD